MNNRFSEFAVKITAFATLTTMFINLFSYVRDSKVAKLQEEELERSLNPYPYVDAYILNATSPEDGSVQLEQFDLLKMDSITQDLVRTHPLSFFFGQIGEDPVLIWNRLAEFSAAGVMHCLNTIVLKNDGAPLISLEVKKLEEFLVNHDSPDIYDGGGVIHGLLLKGNELRLNLTYVTPLQDDYCVANNGHKGQDILGVPFPRSQIKWDKIRIYIQAVDTKNNTSNFIIELLYSNGAISSTTIFDPTETE